VRRLHRLLDALGPAGIAGTGVLFFCVPFYLTALAPAERDVQRRSARPAVQPAAAEDGAAELERFYARFPPIERLAGEVQALYARARASQLQLQQGEYRLEPGSGRLAAYRVTLPVRGSYAQVRQFAGAVLKDMPTASLDALRFERKKAGDTQLEAQVRLTLYLRKGT